MMIAFTFPSTSSVSLTKPLLLSLVYFLSLTLSLFDSLFTFMETETIPIHTHAPLTALSASVSPVIPQPHWLYKQRLSVWLCCCVLVPLQLICGQDPGLSCVPLIFFWRASQNSSSEPEYKFFLGSFVIFSVCETKLWITILHKFYNGKVCIPQQSKCFIGPYCQTFADYCLLLRTICCCCYLCFLLICFFSLHQYNAAVAI